MDETTLVKEVLEEHFPDECLVVGATGLAQTINTASSSSPSAKELPGGHEHDLKATLEILAAAVVFVRELIKLYALLRQQLGKPPSPTELARAASKSATVKQAGVESKKTEIATTLVAKIQAPG